MKADLKQRVTDYLIKKGNNPADVIDMINLHFERAKKYQKVSEIAMFIRIVY